MKPKTMMLMVVAIGCGLAASYMTSRLLAERNNQPPPDEKVTILVAKKKISPWVPLKDPENYFELKEVPKEIANDKCLKSFDEVKDQRLKATLTAGKFVTTEDLLNKDQMGLSGQLLPGQRAIALKVNAETLAGGFILPGTRVDVLSTIRGGAADSNAQTILQDMLVLAVDTKNTRDPENPTIIGSTVTLAAKPEECQRLSLAQAMGELRLTLRAIEDHKAPRLKGTKIDDLSKPIHDPSEREPVVEADKGETRVTATVPTVPTVPAVPGKVAPAKDPKAPTVAAADPKKAAPTKAEPRKAESEPVVAAKPHPRRHKLKIINGEYTQTAVFVWDEGEGWKKGRLGQNPDEDDDPPPATRRSKTPPSAPRKPEAVPAPAAPDEVPVG